jgi:hypothetical protein
MQLKRTSHGDPGLVRIECHSSGNLVRGTAIRGIMLQDLGQDKLHEKKSIFYILGNAMDVATATRL